jgi:hypothetical protein
VLQRGGQKARWSHARERSLTRPARRTPQEEDGSLRFRRKNDTKRAFQLHGLSRCAPAARRAPLIPPLWHWPGLL